MTMLGAREKEPARERRGGVELTQREETLTTASLICVLGIFAVGAIGGGVAAAIKLHGGERFTVTLASLVAGAAIVALMIYLVVVPLSATSGVQPSSLRSDEYSTLAIAAFICAFLVALPGIILGHLAVRDVARTGKRGRGLAIAALVLSYTFLIGGVLVYVALFLILSD